MAIRVIAVTIVQKETVERFVLGPIYLSYWTLSIDDVLEKLFCHRKLLSHIERQRSFYIKYSYTAWLVSMVFFKRWIFFHESLNNIRTTKYENPISNGRVDKLRICNKWPEEIEITSFNFIAEILLLRNIC